MRYINFQLDSLNEFCDAEAGPLNDIGPIEHINIFIGPNNSRKSRLAREILKINNHCLSDSPLSGKFSEVFSIARTLSDLFSKHSLVFKIQQKIQPLEFQHVKNRRLQKDEEVIFLSYLSHDHENVVTIDSAYFKQPSLAEIVYRDTTSLRKHIDRLLSIEKELLLFRLIQMRSGNQHLLLPEYFAFIKYARHSEIDAEIHKIVKQLCEGVRNLSKIQWSIVDPVKYYTPTLRGLIPLDAKEKIENFYKDTTVRLYEFETEHAVNIETGLDLYKRIRSARNARKPEREKFEKFEQFLSENFFPGKKIDIVAIEDSTTIQIYIEQGMDREIFNLGDGMQSLIILMFSVYMAEKDSWIVIEEPETHLHPGLQTILLNTLIHNEFLKTKQLKIFLITHSNHLLGYLMDKETSLSLFSFEPHGGKSMVRHVAGRDINILRLIGATNGSVYMANCTVWVEGVSDRRILESLLRLYMKSNRINFIEDYDYTYFEYAGSNISHYLFSEEEITEKTTLIDAYLISNRIWLLSDEDEGKEIKHRRLIELATDKFVYQTTGGREIENIVPKKVYHELIKPILSDDQRLNAFIQRWDYVELESKRIGKHLTESMRRRGISAKFHEKSGTLTNYYKEKLARLVVKMVDDGSLTWDDVCESSHAKRLILSLYGFIERNALRTTKK